MISTSIYFDCRSESKTGDYPLLIIIRNGKSSANFPLGIKIKTSQWDGTKVYRCSDANTINALIAKQKAKVDTAIYELRMEGKIDNLRATEIRDKVLQKIDPQAKALARKETMFENIFFNCIDTKKTDGNRIIYERVFRECVKYDPAVKEKTFDMLDYKWLVGFDDYLEKIGHSVNGRSLSLRTLRAVFNYANDMELTRAYPFRKFKIRQEPTRKRSLNADNLREFFNYPVEPWQEQYMDYFKLMFFLCGINNVDLANLRYITKDGRIEYTRAKTHRLYSIKVEPEAMAIIRRHRGKEYLLDIMEKYSDYHTWVQHMSKAMKKVGCKYDEHTKTWTGKALCQDISPYWMRHSWATICAELDIPKETIARGLGHADGYETTNIYIDFDQKKVDDANRKVIDYVLYNKK